ncbi:MAG: AMP-binding protein [Terracidiphilus sp.]
MRENLATLIQDFKLYGREIAVVRYQGNRRRVTTYGELARLAGRFAALLDRRGIGQGERVILWAENGAEWMGAFFGCMLRGVLAVPLDPGGAADFAVRVAADVRPRLAVGDLVLLDRLGAALQSREPGTDPLDFPLVAIEDWGGDLPDVELGPVAGLTHDTPLEILFTSGTTGEPKGVVLTHGNVLASVEPVAVGSQPYMRYERLVHPLRILHTLPLSHVFGQAMGLWVPPIYRAEVHFESRLAAPRLAETIKRERINVLAAVPRIAAILKSYFESRHPGLGERAAASKTKNPFVRWWRFWALHRELGIRFWALVSGGGALSVPVEKFWNSTGFVVIQGYGMTETTALITLNHPFHRAEGSIGKPLYGRDVKLGPDGEVLVKGATISNASWQGGRMMPREEEWLATGDLAEREASGDLKFLGRKSEVIVTASGVNVHPEDLEAAVEEQAGVAACAVVAMETPNGPEPCAVLAFRGTAEPAAAIEAANRKLAEYQRLLRWVLWPEPDLPRTSTGKVRRKVVAEWLARIQSAATTGGAGAAHTAGTGSSGASADWLLALIEQTTGEAPSGVGDELRLAEDLHLDSLGRVQLSAALEERIGGLPGTGMLEGIETLGDLRKLVAGEHVENEVQPAPAAESQDAGPIRQGQGGFSTPAAPPASAQADSRSQAPTAATGLWRREEAAVEQQAEFTGRRYIYPRWPWWAPFQWSRVAFAEAAIRPFVWFLGNPRIARPQVFKSDEPMLIVSNHVTAYDGALVEYALPPALRRRLAIAMSGEMLDDFRHWRVPHAGPRYGRFELVGPIEYLLLTWFFNVFPLPHLRSFQASFAHAGRALDRGYNVLVFPEGTLSKDGYLARFRPGIGLLAKQCGAPLLPVALAGVGKLKRTGSRWFRSGKIEMRIGEPIRFSPLDSEAAITERLHDEVARLLDESRD